MLTGCYAYCLDGGGEDVGRAGQKQAGDRPGGFHTGGVAMEGAVRRLYQPAVAKPGSLL